MNTCRLTRNREMASVSTFSTSEDPHSRHSMESHDRQSAAHGICVELAHGPLRWQKVDAISNASIKQAPYLRCATHLMAMPPLAAGRGTVQKAACAGAAAQRAMRCRLQATSRL